MKTIVANVEFLEVSRDPAGPIIFVAARALNETAPDLFLAFYLSGLAASKLLGRFFVGRQAAVEIKLCLGLHLGRLVRVGFPKRPDWREDEECPLPIPFGDPDEYENHFFINQVEMRTTMAVACPPYGYEEPFADLKPDINEGDTQ